jgi:proteic killer suppression protein
MIVSFKNKGTTDIFAKLDTRAARNTCPPVLWPAAHERLHRVHHATHVMELMTPGNRLKRLRGARYGQHSIRINDQYRVCFRWRNGGAEDVEIVDYH